MAPNTGRQFKHVFEQANDQLRSTFGCEMTELPQKEKVTISQKRAAQRTQTQNSLSSSSKSYILTSTLAAPLRTPAILPAPAVPTSAAESAYVGLYTFILALIYISPGQSMAESRLEKQLKRMNADNYVLSGEKTEKVLKKMEKEGYILKVRERDGGGEETVDYMVGPRGKAEVGENGVAGLIRKVWGKTRPERVDLERRLVRSLGDGVGSKSGREGPEENEEETQMDEEEGEDEEDHEEGRGVGKRRTARGAPKTPARRTSGRRGRNALVEDEADGEDDEEKEEEEEEEGAESEDE
ncbi:MAG: hypothetical protein LQ344_002788 [Seirophora lacunosa]|nr:MAG: hypothetical protein LQ344_002788 [Seirophora lacunosa]